MDAFQRIITRKRDGKKTCGMSPGLQEQLANAKEKEERVFDRPAEANPNYVHLFTAFETVKNTLKSFRMQEELKRERWESLFGTGYSIGANNGYSQDIVDTYKCFSWLFDL